MTSAVPMTQTHPADEVWTDAGCGFRRWETSVVLGTRAEVWEWATTVKASTAGDRGSLATTLTQ
ncbi:hypothetical protein [Microbacterium sp. NPDC080220]|uniref:hypothetical protein n=1 Tax=Microbacterium sp. NPDC080220 TaxID=3161017 RepID=UPI003419B718